jgi:hypothetical protein
VCSQKAKLFSGNSKIIENLRNKSVPIQDLNVTSEITSCINNLTIVPGKSIVLPPALNSGKKCQLEILHRISNQENTIEIN